MMESMTVKELREALASCPDDAPVQIWLPGTYIAISAPMIGDGKVLIEGNVISGGIDA